MKKRSAAWSRVRTILLFAVAGVVLLWSALPLWFPWVLRPVARTYGARYGRYERIGYRRFALRDVAFESRTLRIRARRIEAFVPSIWLWRLLVERGHPNQPFLSDDNWQLEFLQSTSGPPASVYSTVQDAENTFAFLARWIPMARLSTGTLKVDSTVLAFADADWSRGVLSAELALPKIGQPAQVTARVGHGLPFELRLKSGALQFDSAWQISRRADGLNLQGGALWWSNHVDLQAKFDRQGLLPAKASLQATNFLLPQAAFGLSQIRNLRGSLLAAWDGQHFTADLRANVEPVIPKSTAPLRPAGNEPALPPVQVVLHAGGDTNQLTVQTASLSWPGLSLELAPGMKIYFEGPLLRDTARLTFTGDLSKLPLAHLQGQISGQADLSPSASQFPVVHFQVSSSDIGSREFLAKKLTMRGNLNWPWLLVERGDAQFEEDTTASIQGRIDLKQMLVEDGYLEARGSLARRWLPRGYELQGLEARANFHGSLDPLFAAAGMPAAVALSNLLASPFHSGGQITATQFSGPWLRPVQLRASWTNGPEHSLQASIFATTRSSSFSGALEWKPMEASDEFFLRELALQTYGQSVFELARPAHFRFHGVPSTTNHWNADIDPLVWRGPGREVQFQASVDWPRAGGLECSISNLQTATFADFLKAPAYDFNIRRFAASANWTNSPLRFGLELSGSASVPATATGLTPGISNVASAALNFQTNAAEVQAHVIGGLDGLVLSNFTVASQSATVVEAHGFLPLTITPGAITNILHLDTTKPVLLRAISDPRAPFWQSLASRTGLTLRQPDLEVDLSGTWDKLQGRAQFQARQLLLAGARQNLPSIDDIHVDLLFDRQQARLDQCRFFVQGQPVALQGMLPLGPDFLRRLQEKRTLDLHEASGRLQVANAPLAAFAPFGPQWLSPQGELDLEVELRPGLQWQGHLGVRNARTRVLPEVGPIRDIGLELKFRQQTVELAELHGNIGSAPVSASGRADLRGLDLHHLVLPPFVLEIHGSNVPLSRLPDSIVRSNLRLSIARTNGAPPLISGEADLRNSYFLSDMSDLIPKRTQAPASRPPYFSIDDPFLADWRLAVKVNGARFLKVRSTLFSGEISASLTLEGTLTQPVLLGDLKVDSGRVLFPFGSMDVQNGFVSLTRQDPFQPRLALTATSRQFGYDVRLEVSGTVEKPIIQFTSTPPLSSEQILLMVSAGQLPQGGVSLAPQQREQTLALFFGRDILSRLGFDSGAQQRLTIRSGQELSEQGVPTYEAELTLTPRWALTGERDEFDDYNFGLKWKVYSK